MSSQSGPPCCCMPLQNGISILAATDAVLNITILILWGLFVFVSLLFGLGSASEREKSHALIYSLVIIIVCGGNIALAVYLMIGAKQRNPQTCLVWLIITGILLLLFIISLGVQQAESMGSRAGSFLLVCGVIRILYTLYEMWVVLSFRNEILRNGNNVPVFAVNTVSVNTVNPYANPYQVPSQSHTAGQSQNYHEGVAPYPYPQSQG